MSREHAPTTARMRPWLGHLGLIAVSTVIALLAAEVVLRAFPDLGRGKKTYEFKVSGDLYAYGAGAANVKLKPSATYQVETPEYNYTAYTNALGLRDYEFSKAKPAGTLRIGIVADSIAFGPGVPLEQIFAKRLERSLAADPPLRDTQIQVVDLGIPSYSGGQNYLTVRDLVPELDIDVVVLAHVPNDAMEWPFHPDERGLPKDFRVSQAEWQAKRPDQPPSSAPKTSVPAWLDVAGRYSRIARLARDALTDWQLREFTRGQSDYPIGDVWQDPFWPMRKAGYADDAQWKLHERISLETARLAKAAGRKFLLVTIPMGAQLNSYEWDWGRAAHKFAPGITVSDESQERIRDLLGNEGYPTLDLLPPLRRGSSLERRMFFPYDGHLTPEGHEVVAKAMDRAIRVLLGAEKKEYPKTLLDELVVAHPDATLHLEAGEADIVTPPDQFFYAARLPFHKAGERKAVTGVRAKIHVLQGRIQIGVLEQGGKTWIALSEPLAAGPEQTVELRFSAMENGDLVFANSAVADGQRAKLQVTEITLVEGD
jgi:acetyltransferase AlgX (SGNH hydrolase-like protein)